MGRRCAQDAAVTLLSAVSPPTNYGVFRRLNGSQWRRLSITPRPRPSGRRWLNTETKDANIAVLGGGLTGLTTAYYLAKHLPPTAKITLYEGSDRLGGWIKTEKHAVDVDEVKGTVQFERGPRSLTSLSGNYWRYDDLVFYDLCLDLGLQYVSVPSKPRYIYYPDHLVPLPPAASIFQSFKEQLFTETIWAAFGLLWRTFRTRRLPAEDQSVTDWIQEVSGSKALADNFASAMVHGIYGGDIDKLSARSVLDKLYWGWYIPNPGAGARPMPMPERDLLETLGQDKQIQKMACERKSALIHFGAAGMESLPKALAAALQDQSNVEIKLKTPATDVAYDGTHIKVTTSASKGKPQRYDKVISTVTSQNLARITNNQLPSLAGTPSVSIMTVNIWYPFPSEALKPPGFGYLIPRSVPAEANPEQALGVFFDSDVETTSPDEPKGTKLFVLMGGHHYEGKTPPTQEEAIRQAKALLERHLGISQHTPCHAVAQLAKDCIPQHHVGHHRRMLTADQELQDHFGGRLAVAGGSYTRIGVVAALRAGYDIATHTAKIGLNATGLEALKTAESFAVVPISHVPVRRFRR